MIVIPIEVLIGALILSTLVLAALVVRMEIRLNKVFRGKNGGDVEDEVRRIDAGLQRFFQFEEEMAKYVASLEKRVSRSAQVIATRRYNPFKGTGEGGNNSSSTAILSEKGDGVIITTLYARERMSVFAKQIEKFASPANELTPEEKGAIDDAKQKIR